LTSNRTQLGIETLQRDAAALFSFVDSIGLHCYQDSESPTYLAPSVDFFKYVRELGEATKAYLNVFPSQAPGDRRLYQDYRQKLETIRSSWFELHQLIKPAADADTLNIPYTLVEALTRRLNWVQRFETTKFAILHFDELNYFEVPVSDIREATNRLRSIIPDAPAFRENLGLIGIPYSQSSSLHLNYLICHEMGHFVFQESKLKDKLLPHIETSIVQALYPQLEQTSSDDLDWSKDRLASWSEELFCDLFAVWLIGPCYTLAYVELFGLTTVLDPASTRGFSPTAGSLEFGRIHPADLFRLKQQVILLRRLNWWGEVDAIRSHYVDVLRCAVEIDDSELEFRTHEQPPDYSRKTLKAFLALAPRIMELVIDVMRDSKGDALEPGVSNYQRFVGPIGEYLRRAVVPSTILEGDDHWYPDPVALLNASMKFYLESIEGLMNTIEAQKTSLAGHRSRWIQRVESLTAKAIEDYQLLVAEKGALQVGSSFKRPNPKSS